MWENLNRVLWRSRRVLGQKLKRLTARVKARVRAFSRTKAGQTLKARWQFYAAMMALLVLLGAASSAYRSRRGEEAVAAQARVAPPSAGEASPADPEPVNMVWPVAGDIIGAFAPDRAVWSDTLQQWQNHPGIDIAAGPGEAVAACRDGVIADAWKDAAWGNVVVVDHGDGCASTYANLNTLQMAQIGRQVRAGEIIGAVGDSADCESSLPWHLHFEYARDGVPVDFAALMAAPGER